MNLINFIRGDEVTGLRTRMLEVPVGSGNYKVWRLGDPIHSTPTIVGAPKARYDLSYGDSAYNAFYQQGLDLHGDPLVSGTAMGIGGAGGLAKH